MAGWFPANRETKEVEEVRDTALLSTSEGTTRYPGMTYEEGVEAALSWVLDDRDTNPLED